MSKIKTNTIQHNSVGADTYTIPATDGSSGQVIKTDGSGNLGWVKPGVVIRKTYLTIPRNTCTHTYFPHDDTIPQITEGAEVWNGNYTPSTASCDLYITTHFSQSEQNNNADAMSCALFVSGTNDALQVRSHYTSSSGWEHNHAMSFMYKMASWGTTQKTFSIRFGGGDSINYAYASSGASSGYYSQAGTTTGFVIEEVAT